MKNRKALQRGAVIVVLALAGLAAAGLVSWRILSVKTGKGGNAADIRFAQGNNNAANGRAEVRWIRGADNVWTHEGEPPDCPSPIGLPVRLDRVTSVLYPGQYRGGDYKPHGGFRFDNNTTNDEPITAPFDAEVVRGARYLAKGDVQYVFDFISPCGYMYRLGHLLTLSPKLQAAAEKLPMNGEGDSRDSEINPRVAVKAGEIIATATGLSWGNGGGGANVFVDWGVYDLRSKNEVSQNGQWAAVHKSYTEQYAVCWFDLLSQSDEARIRALPSSDMYSGRQSDYCKEQ